MSKKRIGNVPVTQWFSTRRPNDDFNNNETTLNLSRLENKKKKTGYMKKCTLKKGKGNKIFRPGKIIAINKFVKLL